MYFYEHPGLNSFRMDWLVYNYVHYIHKVHNVQRHDIYFITGNVYPLTSLTQTSPSASGIHQSVVYTHMPLLLLSRFSRVRTLAPPWTAAHQAPPSLGLSRQEYWSGLPLPLPSYVSSVILLILILFSICVQGTRGDFINRKHPN